MRRRNGIPCTVLADGPECAWSAEELFRSVGRACRAALVRGGNYERRNFNGAIKTQKSTEAK
jgi:hypothetical protein